MAGSHDVAVIGLGLVGAAALRHLSKAGVKSVGVGPAEPADWATHEGVFASHYDSGRITRRLDARREWAVLAGRSIGEYSGVEQASGTTFHFPVGVVIAEVDPARVRATTEVATGLGVHFDRFEPGQSIGDDRIILPASATVLTEGGPGGFIDPRRMLAAQLVAARQHGAVTVDEQVVGVERRDRAWIVRTESGVVDAEQIVVATGPHADELKGLPRQPHLDVIAETVVLAQVLADEQRRLAGLPSIVVDDPDHDHLYIVPPTGYPDGNTYVKLGATRQREVLTPDQRRSWMAGESHAEDLEWMRQLMLGVLPGLHAGRWLTKPCLIPQTPTGLPYVEIVDEGCVMAVGGNGYAAKSADAIGALAAGLVVNGAWSDPDLEERSFNLTAKR